MMNLISTANTDFCDIFILLFVLCYYIFNEMMPKESEGLQFKVTNLSDRGQSAHHSRITNFEKGLWNCSRRHISEILSSL